MLARVHIGGFNPRPVHVDGELHLFRQEISFPGSVLIGVGERVGEQVSLSGGLILAEQLEVTDRFPFTFYGETFLVALASDRKRYVPLTRICEILDIDTGGRIQRIQRDEAIADSMVKLSLEVPYGDRSVFTRDVNCLRLDKLPYWLGTIDANRISD